MLEKANKLPISCSIKKEEDIMSKLFIVTLLLLGISFQAHAEQAQAEVYSLTDAGQGIKHGEILFADTAKGLLVEENLVNLPTGAHGIHVHEKGDCSSTTVDGKTILGGAAGGHYDPHKTGKHSGPNASGHKGDLPVLMVNNEGKVSRSFYLQGVTAADFKGRSVIIHAAGDNYQDTPKPLGGGGDRIACGLIK